MSNQIAQKPKFSTMVQTKGYQNLIFSTLQDPQRAQRFIASISSAVAVNPALQECDAGTILSCALLGESLNLSPSPQLGQYYLVPFKKKNKVKSADGTERWEETSVATFILGYKGYIQLALRSGQYKKLNVMAIKKGELIRYDALEEEIEVNPIQDEAVREATETVGYYAMFEYLNGFKKAMYWSKEKMLYHADRYSSAFNLDSYNKLVSGKVAEKDMWKYSSNWYKDFDGMAYKTMLRQIISKWGVTSIEMQEAYAADSNPDYKNSELENLSSDIPPMLQNSPAGAPQIEKQPKKQELVSLDDI